MIKFSIFDPPMPNLQGKYIAKVSTGQALDLDFLAQQVAQSGIACTSTEVKNILARTCEIIEQQITIGHAIQLGGICSLRPSVRGTFDNFNDGFNPERNWVDVSVTAGERLRKGVRENAQTEKAAKPAPLPDMHEYYDVSTGHYNEDISVGNIGQFNGASLSYDATDPEQGLFVVDGVSPSPMPIATIQKATDKQIVFLTNNIAPAATNVHFLLRRRNEAEGPLVEAQSRELTVTA